MVLPLLRKAILVMMPPLFLILLVLGSIFAGIATPTEAGALGAVGGHGPGRGQPSFYS